MNDQNIVTEAPQNVTAVFVLPLAQSIELLTALVHDPGLPYRVRQGTALLLLPHLRIEHARLLAQQGRGPIREREEDYKIGWT